MNIKVNVVLVKNQRVKGSATVVFDDCFKATPHEDEAVEKFTKKW